MAKRRHPEIYIERHEDTRSRKRTVPMKVLSLGYSRTGTMTMKAAFETLGIPTWHWVTQSENPPDLVSSAFSYLNATHSLVEIRQVGDVQLRIVCDTGHVDASSQCQVGA